MNSPQLNQTGNQGSARCNRSPHRSGRPNRIEVVFFWILLASSLLAACANPSAPTLPTHLPQPATPTQAPPDLPASATSSDATKPLPVPTDTPLACLTAGGVIEVHEIHHQALVAPLRVRVYIPPCYDQDSYATYPTLLLLHGLLATDVQWDDLGVDEVADRLIQSQTSPPFIILMPWIRNSQDPLVAVIDVLIPYAQAHWRMSADRDFWSIGGISRGAGQALQIGLLYPEQFRAIGLHSPAILHAPELLLSWIQSIEIQDRPEIWLDIGETDSLYSSTRSFLDLFLQAGIPITYHINQGDHTRNYWQEHLPAYLAWYRSIWMTPATPKP
jgi:enterochelin esterase-like enzyme